MNKNNTSGYVGVSFEPKANKYRAYISIAGEKVRLGYFSSAYEAYQARLEMESFYSLDENDVLRIPRFVRDFKYKSFKLDVDTMKEYLISAIISYKWQESSFATFAFKHIASLITGNKAVNNNVDFSTIENNEIMSMWVRGISINKISKKTGEDTRVLTTKIKQFIGGLKNGKID